MQMFRIFFFTKDEIHYSISLNMLWIDIADFYISACHDVRKGKISS